ncbi:hypothetical protein PI124_g9279 [Phytophthora idaei]|nr:hypothetical protein PI125_g18721 [Phytophthora idaei]KAG3245981.1 hypothetical protein PI124_g9279 [Phytophthora idaei]
MVFRTPPPFKRALVISKRSLVCRPAAAISACKSLSPPLPLTICPNGCVASAATLAQTQRRAIRVGHSRLPESRRLQPRLLPQRQRSRGGWARFGSGPCVRWLDGARLGPEPAAAASTHGAATSTVFWS